MAIPDDVSSLYGGVHPPMIVDYSDLYESALRYRCMPWDDRLVVKNQERREQ